MVLPNPGVHWWTACLDLDMFIMLGAMERNGDQWHTLLERAGLMVLDIKTYMPMMRNSVVIAALKQIGAIKDGGEQDRTLKPQIILQRMSYDAYCSI